MMLFNIQPLNIQPQLARPTTLLLAITIGLLSSALAHSHPSSNHLRGIVSTGLTFGGDEIDEFVVEREDIFGDDDRDIEDVSAGELFFISGGALFESGPLQLQGTIGYYVDGIVADNGDANFVRWPLEVLGFYRFEHFRIGVGPTYHLNPEFELELDNLSDDEIEFDNALGAVIQADYLFHPFGENGVQFAVGARVTLIEYEVDRVRRTFSRNPSDTTSRYAGREGTKVDGDSVGMVFTVMF